MMHLIVHCNRVCIINNLSLQAMSDKESAELKEIAAETPFTEVELQGQAMKAGHMIGSANPLGAAQ